MKKVLTAVLFLACLGAFSASAQTIESLFTQTRTIQASGKKIVSEGTFSFTAPDQLAMLYTKPDGDYIIIDGPFVRTMTKGTEVNLDTRTNAQARNLSNTLLNCILGKYQQVADDNDGDVSVSEKGGVKTVTIKVRKQAPRGYSGVTIKYRKDGTCTEMTLDEFGGISTHYVLKDIQRK